MRSTRALLQRADEMVCGRGDEILCGCADEMPCVYAGVNGPLTQYAEFADAWKCSDKAIMAPPNRCGKGFGPVW